MTRGHWISVDGTKWELLFMPPNIDGDGTFGAVGDLLSRSSDNHRTRIDGQPDGY